MLVKSEHFKNLPRKRIGCCLAIAALFVSAGEGYTLTLLEVTTNADSGAGSLRNRIETANAGSGNIVISFSLTAGNRTISPASALPEITHSQTYIIGNEEITLSGASLAGTEAGLSIKANSCIIQGLTIVSFPGYGISIEGDGNKVYNCRIGTDGTNDLGNGDDGLHIDGNNNVVGGLYSLLSWTNRDGRNVISGNEGDGVTYTYSSGGGIYGNLIGVNAAGAATLPNGDNGIRVHSSTSVNIGAEGDTGRNIVSGNGTNGIGCANSSVVIRNNYVGTDITGTVALGNASDGIQLTAGSNGSTVGLDWGDHTNVIAGNGRNGILVVGSSNCGIYGNHIGVDVTGNQALANVSSGIDHISGQNLEVGQAENPDRKNIISGNGEHGIRISYNANATGSAIVGNRIGVGMNPSIPLGNSSYGIFVEGGNSGIMIGGASASEDGNMIAHNKRGVSLSATATAVSIRRNGIWNHEWDGIYLASGANGGIAAPVIAGVHPVVGTAPANSVVDVFVDYAAEGKTYVGATTANASGVFQLDVDLSAYFGRNVTATATDASGNTSMFSAPFPYADACTVLSNPNVPEIIDANSDLVSTFTVAQNMRIADIKVLLDVTLDYEASLNASLESPTGQSIYLFDQLPSAGSNLMDTIFDDQAANRISWGGPPFTGSFRPADSLTHFYGQETAGAWTFTIDNSGGATPGTLNKVDLCVTPAAFTCHPSSDIPVTANPGQMRGSTLTIADSLIIADANIFFTITTDHPESVAVSLDTPLGIIDLFENQGKTGYHFAYTVLDDEASQPISAGSPPYGGQFQPQTPLSNLDGTNAQGDWTLVVSYTAGTGNATISAWSLCITPDEGVTEFHTADQDHNNRIGLSELLRVIQFFNSDGYHCDASGEDGYNPGPGDQSCTQHQSDYNPANWRIGLSELLRLIQFFNSGGYHACPSEGTEDGYCVGLP